MAKDGTNRGGARVGAGRKPKPLKDKVLEGRVSVPKMPEAPVFEGVDVPPPKEYMKRGRRTDTTHAPKMCTTAHGAGWQSADVTKWSIRSSWSSTL